MPKLHATPWCVHGLQLVFGAAFVLGLIVLVCSPLRAETFEGHIQLQTPDARSGSWQLDYFVKADRTRIMWKWIDADYRNVAVIFGNMMSMGLIFDARPGPQRVVEGWMENPFAKSYRRMDLALQPSEGKATMNEAGSPENILGYACTKYTYQDKSMDVQVWATKDLCAFPGVGPLESLIGEPKNARTRAISGFGTPWAQFLAKKGLFPLKILILEKKTQQSYAIDAKLVTAEPVDAAVFAPPADFKAEERPPTKKR